MYKLSKYNVIEKEENVYIYNLLSRVFIALPIEKWNIIKNNEFERLHKEEIELLVNNYLLIPENVDEENILLDNYREVFYDNKTVSIFLSMTPQCNFNCVYCYQDCRKELNDMMYISKENIDKLVKYVKKLNGLNIGIVYFGGEPSINEDNLLYAIQEFNKLGVVHTIITNGYSFSKEMMNIIEEMDNIRIQITIDGDKSIHDKKRVTVTGEPTFEKVYNNVLRLSAKNLKKLNIRLNIDLNLVEGYYLLIDKMYEDGLVEVGALSLTPIFDGQKKKNGNDSKGYNEYIKLLEYATEKGFNVDVSVEFAPCLAHMKKSFAVDEKLNTYVCPGTLYQKSIGIISDNGNHLICDNDWYDSRIEGTKCMLTCEYGPICLGGCKIENKCRKDQIQELLPYIMKRKIQEYKKKIKNNV